MTVKKNIHISYPASEKVYVPGEINKIKVGMRKIKLQDTQTTDNEGIQGMKKNNPVIVYDTSGPYSDTRQTLDSTLGIPRIREEWYARRKDLIREERLSSTATYFPCPYLPLRAKEGKNITQMYYAKRRIITPEMEYVAIRENQQIEALCLKSYITPEFVRKEVAAGRAVIPANINHPEAEPMIIGKKFLVKINTHIGHSPLNSSIDEEVEKAICSIRFGSDLLMDLSTGKGLYNTREWLIRNSPVPMGTVPLLEALSNVNGKVELLTWKVYKDTLIEQAEQGVDLVTIHAAMLRKHIDLAGTRLTGIASCSGAILNKWMRIHNEENFLYTHFEEICAILKRYDIVLSIGSGLSSGSIYDANDSSQFAELYTMGELTRTAWSHYVQVITEGPGHTPMNKVKENATEQQYACHGAPHYTQGPITTDIAPGYDHITSAIGAAQIAWYGTSLLGCVTPREHIGLPDKEDIRAAVVAYKIAAHAADLAKGHPGAQVRDNAISKARIEFRWKDQFHLSIDPERAIAYYKDSAIIGKDYCSMCGSDFCASKMNKEQKNE
ncbi:MAG: phosphomethylpyrimidine synthase ThiC [Tannerellaceae bacterium]